MIIYNENNYLNQYRDLKQFYKKHVGNQLLSLTITYDKLKLFYPIQIFDERFQADYITPKKIRLFDECDETPLNTILYVILIKHRENKMVFDGKKIVELKILLIE